MGCTISKLRGGIRISYLNARNRPTVSGGGQPPFLRVPMKLPSGSGSKTDYSFESYRNRLHHFYPLSCSSNLSIRSARKASESRCNSLRRSTARELAAAEARVLAGDAGAAADAVSRKTRPIAVQLRALIWVLRRQRAVDYGSIYRENEKQMETIPKKRLRRIGIRNDISLTIKPSSIIIPIAPTVLLRRPPRL
jgi:hypothetical protein